MKQAKRDSRNLEEQVREIIRDYMHEHHITQAQLAKKISSNQPSVSRLLNGQTKLDLTSMEIILCALGVNPQLRLVPQCEGSPAC